MVYVGSDFLCNHCVFKNLNKMHLQLKNKIFRNTKNTQTTVHTPVAWCTQSHENYILLLASVPTRVSREECLPIEYVLLGALSRFIRQPSWRPSAQYSQDRQLCSSDPWHALCTKSKSPQARVSPVHYIPHINPR